MSSFATVIHSRRFKMLAFSLAAIIAFAMPAAAQHGLSLSNQADFSTSDRLFVDGETIYIKVEGQPGLDAASVTQSSFEAKPIGDGEEFEGILALQEDGSFTGSVEVSALEGNSSVWHLRAKIEDAFDHEYEARTAIVIRGRSGQPDVFRVSGTVATASESVITVGGQAIAVTSDTKLHTRLELGVPDLEGRDVVVRVQQEADETLTALQIFVQGEQSAAIDIAGRIMSVRDGSVEIRGVWFGVDEQTIISSRSGAALSLEDLTRGMGVRVKAQQTEDGWLATSITAIARTADADDADDEDGDDDDEVEDEEEDEVEGTIEEIGEDFIVVAGIQLEISDSTEFKGAEGLESLELDMDVEVEFVTTEVGAFAALKVEVEEDDHDDENENEIEVKGLITALGEHSITVEGIEFTVDDTTQIKGGGRENLAFADLTTGLHVEVEGFVQEGATIARKIDVEVEEENRAQLRGEITALGDSTATVGDTEFHVTDATEIRGERGAELTFEELAIGMHAKVLLTAGEEGTPQALRIKVKQPFESDDIKITGRIEAVSPTEITVREHTFSITEDTEIENRDGDEIAADVLDAGMVAKVEGVIADDGSLVATEIKVRAQLHQEGRFSGLVTAIAGEVIAVNGVEFSVSDDTILEGADTLEDIVLGTRVKLRFRQLGDSTLFALRIQVKTDEDVEAEISGAIEEIGGEVIVVAGVDVTTSAATEIEDEDGNAATLAALEVGQTVEVKGTAIAGGILATKIKIEDAVVVSGAVSEQGENTVQLAGITFRIDGETLIIGRENALLRIDDLEAGAYVEVIATADAAAGKNGSTMTAERVLVISSASSPTARGEEEVPGSFTLAQNYPNPFNPTTTITFELNSSAAGHVSLEIYSVLGQRIATLVSGTLSAGTYTYNWDGQDSMGRAAASGIYLYRLKVGTQTATRSMILTK